MIKSGKWYDRLKFMAQIGLPALGALYFGLSQIWGLPKGEEVVGSIVVIDTFLGALLGISTKQYLQSDEGLDGKVVVDTSDPELVRARLEFDGETPVLNRGQRLTFKVIDQEDVA